MDEVKVFSVRIKASLLDEIRRLAQANCRTMAGQVNHLIITGITGISQEKNKENRS